MLALLGVAAPVRAQVFQVGSFAKTVSTAVAFQAPAASASVASPTTSVTITAFNPGAGSNRLLVVGLSFGQGAGGSVTVKYGATNLVIVPGTSGTNGTAHTEMWYLVNPSSTASDIVANWTGNHDVVMGAVAFNNVDQTTPIQNGTFATATSNAPSVTINSRPGNMTMAVTGKLSTLTAATQTQRWLDTSKTNIKAGGSTAVGADTVAHGFTSGSSTAWVTSGVDIRQASGQTQAVAHTLGLVPKALILWTEGETNSAFTANSQSAFGATDGTTSRSVAGASQSGVTPTNTSRRQAAKVLTIVHWGEVTLAEADLTSWDASNFNLTWTTNDTSAYVIHFMILGGSSVSAQVVDWTATASGSLIDKTVTGVAFQPNAVLHFMDGDAAALPSSITSANFMLGVMDPDDQWVTATYDRDNVATTATSRGQLTNASAQPACILELTQSQTVQMQAHFVSMNSDGFTVHFDTNTDGPVHIFSLALRGMNIKPGVFSKSVSAATPAFVQQPAAGGIRVGAVSSVAQAFPAASTAGNLIVVTVEYDGPATISSVTDNNSNTYTLAVGPTNWGGATNVHTATYYAKNITGGAVVTITANLTANATSNIELFQFEYSGVDTVSPFDQSSAAFGTGITLNSGSKTTTQVNELIYAFGASSIGGVAIGSSFNSRSTFDTQFAGDKLAAAIGSYSADGTVPSMSARDWVSQMVTFKGNLQAVTGAEFQPTALLFASFQDVTRAAPVAHARLGIGASDITTEGSTAMADQNGLVGPTTASVQGIDKTTKAFMKVDNSTSTINAEADVTSFDVDGFTLNWTTNDAVATEILYLAFAPLNIFTEVRLMSFTAAKYDRGVLLQWRTGYEIDNLGFNLYREINGVRTKVNTSLIAGSGLRAGQGGVVTAEQTYARWDLDAAATDPTVTYWLEDVEFNGKSKLHGPVTPVAGDLQVPATEDSSALDDLDAATNARRIFFNYNEDPLHPGPRVVPAQVQPEVTSQWALAAQATVKMGIRKPGWYRVTQSELVAAGLGAQVDPRTLQLFVDGTEQAMRVIGEADGRFDSADAIEFYGSGIETAYTDTRIYWLQAGIQRGQRIATGEGGVSAPSTATGFSSTLKRKDRSVFFAALNNGDTENWFGPIISSDPGAPTVPTDLTLTLNHIDRSAVGPAQLSVALQGVTTTSVGSADHRVGVRVNGTDVGEMDFLGKAHAEQTFAVPMAVLVDGENTVTFIASGGVDSSLVDVIKLTYPHTYDADADRLRFSVDAPGPVTIGGFAGRSIRVVDITAPAAPVELPGAVGTEANGSSPVTVYVPGQGPRTLFAFSDETVASPAFIQSNHPSSWHADTNAYDYVLISHADFIEQVRPLAALREQQGHHAAVVDVEDVYDEFSFGQKTPQALRDFLQWARTNWRTPPRFVVLAGDATTDPRDYEGLGNADFVPTRQVAMANVELETASDDWFVDFNDDGLPEVPIGRLSVRTANQAAAVVAKIVGYDQSGQQPWTKNVLLVADQNDDTTGRERDDPTLSNFERSSLNLGALLPANYSANQIFRGALGDNVAHQALIDRVNDGQLIVNYAGHGSVHLWGNGNPTLLQNAFDGQAVDDVRASWQNATRLPFVVAMNCLNGLFDGIWDEESLAEALQRAPAGGAVAVWASSSVTPSSTQALVNQELFRLIFQGTYLTVGEAVAAAKRVVANPDLRRSWIFFGDPAMHLIGTPQPTGQSTTGAPAIVTQPLSAPIASGQRAEIRVVATGTGPLTYQWYTRPTTATMSPIGGATSSTFTTPALTNTTAYVVRVSNLSGTVDSDTAVISTPPTITTPNPWPAATAAAGYSLTLTAMNSSLPYHWEAPALPPGLTLNAATGEVVDTPNAAGTFSFDVRVTGADGVSTQQTFTLTVSAATDVFLDEQWHLKDRRVEVASANVRPAWRTTRGAGVVIGVVDDGLQSTHPDLQANYVASLSHDFDDHDSDPNPVTTGACGASANCQGTFVAGIAAARSDNGLGGSGVAPLASLAGIRLAPHAVDADEASAFSHQLNAVQIENHSWHRADDGQALAAPGPRAEAALSGAIAQGRSGAGRIFVWAAGDGRASGDNCNFDGYANSRFGIAVGAVDDAGEQAWYSESCSALLVSAPSSGAPGVNRSLTTTDLVGAAGADLGDYTSGFGGTSAAAPVVSGVVALMLARNPALTWRDVQHILVRTSRQIDTRDSSFTAGAFSHSERYGFGIVDALAAVNRAATWTNVPAEAGVRAVTHSVGVTIPDNDRAGVSDAIRIGSEYAGFSVEHVEIEFTAAHPHRGDLEVTLTSPSGIVSHLGTVRPGDAGADFAAWRFRSVRHWGESAAGRWILNVADRAAGNVGSFTGWTLRIYGTAAPWADADGGGATTAPPVTRAPDAPNSLTGSVSGTTVALSWRPSPFGSAPTSYILEAGSTSGASNLIVARTGNVATSYTATLVAAGKYFVRVRAANALGTSLPSNEIVVTVAAAEAQPSTGTVVTAIGASITQAANGSVQVTPAVQADSSFAQGDHKGGTSEAVAGWNPGVYGGVPQPAASVPQSARPATSSSQRGEGGNGDGNGAASGTPEPEPKPEPKPEPEPQAASAPGAPTDLVGSVHGSTIVLKWGAPTSGSMPTGYILEAGTMSGSSNLFVSATGTTATVFTTKGAEKGTYYVRLRATNAHGASVPSNEAVLVVGEGDSGPCSAPPSAPGVPRFSVRGRTVTLAWDAAQFGPTSYIVEMSSGPGRNNLVVSDTGNAATALTTKGMAPGTYSFRLRARNACGSSAPSNSVEVVVRPE